MPEGGWAERLKRELRLPIFVAPMFLISGPDLVIASANADVMGAMPAANARSLEQLSAWLTKITTSLSVSGRPRRWAINMLVHPSYDRFDAELDLVTEHRPQIVITALGSPRRPLERVHGYGGVVLADVINPEQARKAIDAGADGVILVAAGAGGHTGRLSPFAFVEEVRAFWDGPLFLGGAIGGARAIKAALTLGADFAYMGTRFIAARQSLVSDDYRAMLVRSKASSIVTTAAVSGVTANWMRESLDQAGFTDEMLERKLQIDFSNLHGDSKAWKNIWGAGHAVGATCGVQTVQEIVDELALEYAHLS